jgi:hypothetical protein
VYACRFGYYTKIKTGPRAGGRAFNHATNNTLFLAHGLPAIAMQLKSESPAAYELDSSPPTTLLWLAGESPPSQLFKTILKGWNSQLEPKVVFVLASVYYKIRDAADTPRANTSHQG